MGTASQPDAPSEQPPPAGAVIVELSTGEQRRLPEKYVNEEAVAAAKELLAGLDSGRIIGFAMVTFEEGRLYRTAIKAGSGQGVDKSMMIGRLFSLMVDLSA